MSKDRDLLHKLADEGADWLIDCVLKFSDAFLRADEQGGCVTGEVGLSDKTFYFKIYDSPDSIDKMQKLLSNTVMVKAKEQGPDMSNINPLVLNKEKDFLGVLLVCDGKPDAQGDILNIDNFKSPSIVPVNINFRQEIPPVGMATVVKDGNNLRYAISLYKGILPKDLYDLVPCFGGEVDFPEKGSKISNVKNMTSVGLAEKNADPRILSLGASATKKKK